jgi:hypothetical protein
METSNAQFWMIRRHDLSLKAIGDVSSRIASNMAQELVKTSSLLQNTVVWRPNSMMRTYKIVLQSVSNKGLEFYGTCRFWCTIIGNPHFKAMLMGRIILVSVSIPAGPFSRT